MLNLQKASFGKRIIAAIFDFIFLVIIAVGLLASFTSVFKTDSYLNTATQAVEKYKTEYNITLTAEEINALSEEEFNEYANRVNQAEIAFANDKTATYAYSMFLRLILIGSTVCVLISTLVIEFITPLFLGNGQTLGKKIFGIALMHKDHIRVSNIQLFVRAVLGKFTVEIMIPLYIIAMALMGRIGISGPIILLILLVIQLICMAKTRTRSLLHDVMSNVIAVDMASQKIFDSREELLEYTKKVHAEKANAKVF